MRILQVNTSDAAGGAERVASVLHQEFLRLGHDAVLAVGRRRTDLSGVIELDNSPRLKGLRRFRNRALDIAGYQYIDFPGFRALSNTAAAWDVVNVHNAHGAYLDLDNVAEVALRTPTVLTLHDMWLFTGHCAHPLGCERWRDHCGRCPHKRTYPRVRIDVTRVNLARKRRALRAPFSIATPARWVADLAQDVKLVSGPIRQLPNPVDVDLFRPTDPAAARRELQLPPERPVLLFPARFERGNSFKDPGTLQAAIELLDDLDPVVVVLGDGHPDGDRRFQRLDGLDDPARMVTCYAAADAVIYPSLVETSPVSLLEAAACGRPVVATAVGGIPELLDDGRGVTVAPRDAEGMAAAVRGLFSDPDGAAAMAQRARHHVLAEHAAPVVATRWIDYFIEVRDRFAADGVAR